MKATSMYIYSNGHISLLDEQGQVIDLVDPWIVTLFKALEEQRIDVRELTRIETNVNGRRTIVRPFKTDEGSWKWELIPYTI